VRVRFANPCASPGPLGPGSSLRAVRGDDLAELRINFFPSSRAEQRGDPGPRGPERRLRFAHLDASAFAKVLPYAKASSYAKAPEDRSLRAG
jgi:hypothetical protein